MCIYTVFVYCLTRTTYYNSSFSYNYTCIFSVEPFSFEIACQWVKHTDTLSKKLESTISPYIHSDSGLPLVDENDHLIPSFSLTLDRQLCMWNWPQLLILTEPSLPRGMWTDFNLLTQLSSPILSRTSTFNPISQLKLPWPHFFLTVCKDRLIHSIQYSVSQPSYLISIHDKIDSFY